MVSNINNTTTNGAATTSSTITGKSKSTLGKDDFFKLMISQLKYQDPLNPTDSTQFSAQLAQFSSLEQLSNMSASLDKSITANYALTQSVNNTMSSTLIGKEIKLGGSDVSFNGESSIQLGYKLPSDAKSVTVKITDSNGSVIKTLDNSLISAGDHKLSWDFTDNNGNKVPYGQYQYAVEAVDNSGNNITTESFKMGTIDSVKFTSQGTKLVIGNSEYDLSNVLEIFGVK
ncbi:MAG: flagellar hook capping FlgD N-terminal domain-containing protein [Ignavibacteria bacterium]